MGRFDKLQQLDKQPVETSLSPSLPATPLLPAKTTQTAQEELPTEPTTNVPVPDQPRPLPVNNETHKPPKKRSRGKANLSPLPETGDDSGRRRYTVWILPRLVRQIRIFAAQRDMDDYVVVESALQRYFAEHE
jgi:hypothetical protein